MCYCSVRARSARILNYPSNTTSITVSLTSSRIFEQHSNTNARTAGTFEELREVAYERLGLKHFLPEEIASIFRENCHGGRISRSKFRHAFELLARMSSVKHDSPLFESVVDEIFDAMDTGDHNGELSASEMYTGLAMLLSK